MNDKPATPGTTDDLGFQTGDPWAWKGGSWVCDACGWEGDPDKVGEKCPGCGREVEEQES